MSPAEQEAKNLAWGRKMARIRQEKAAKRAAREEAERKKLEEAGLNPVTGEKVRGLWVYKDVEYHTLDGVGAAIAATHGNSEQVEAIAAWASMFANTKAGD